MDGIELARQIAARLHTEAIARGVDPFCNPIREVKSFFFLFGDIRLWGKSRHTWAVRQSRI